MGFFFGVLALAGLGTAIYAGFFPQPTKPWWQKLQAGSAGGALLCALLSGNLVLMALIAGGLGAAAYKLDQLHRVSWGKLPGMIGLGAGIFLALLALVFQMVGGQARAGLAIDQAHNEALAEVLAETLREDFPDSKPLIVHLAGEDHQRERAKLLARQIKAEVREVGTELPPEEEGAEAEMGFLSGSVLEPVSAGKYDLIISFCGLPLDLEDHFEELQGARWIPVDSLEAVTPGLIDAGVVPLCVGPNTKYFTEGGEKSVPGNTQAAFDQRFVFYRQGDLSSFVEAYGGSLPAR